MLQISLRKLINIIYVYMSKQILFFSFFVLLKLIVIAQDDIPVKVVPNEIFRSVNKPANDTLKWNWRRGGIVAAYPTLPRRRAAVRAEPDRADEMPAVRHDGGIPRQAERRRVGELVPA